MGLSIVAGPHPRDPISVPAQITGLEPGQRLKVAVMPEPPGGSTHPEIAAAIRRAGDALSDAGHEVVEAMPPDYELSLLLWCMMLFPDFRVLKDQLGKSLAEQAGVDFDSPVREPITPFGGSKAADRGAKGDQGGAGPKRNAARPAPAPRVATGGSGSGPRNAAWRDEDPGKPRGTRVPRRGADPRVAQAAAAERGRERVGSIRTGDRRVVVERLAASPVAVEAPVKARRRYADDGPPGGQRGGSAGSGRAGGFRTEGAAAPRGERPQRSRGQDAQDERPRRPAARSAEGGWGDASPDTRPQGRTAPRRDRPSDGAPAQGAPRGKAGFGGQDRRPAGGKPAFGGAKAGGARPGGKAGGFGGRGPDRNGAGGGGRPGGRPGGKPGGDKPGGGKPGGGRPHRGTR